jgi:hypothetical protein
MDGSQRYRVINLPTDDISRSTAGDANWEDYMLEAKLRISETQSDGAARLFARYQGTNQWYGFGYSKKSGRWEIAKRTGNTDTLLGKGPPFGLETQRYYSLNIQLKGATLKLSVDGVPQATATDTAFPRGKIGFTAWRATALIDDVRVTSLE